MKKLLIAFLFTTLVTAFAEAQIKRNSVMIRTSVQHHDLNSTSVNFIGGDFGFFVLNNFAIGIHHAINFDSGFAFSQPGFFGRYYFKEKLIAGVGYKTIKIDQHEGRIEWNMGINAELGYSYSIKKSFAVDLLLNYNAAPRESYGVSVGGTFFLNRKESQI
jgi:hypothetical protein